MEELDNRIFYRNGNAVNCYRAYFKCPVCEEREINSPQTYWYHSGCGGNIYLGEDAYYYCDRCDVADMIMAWGYHCPYHSDAEDDYVGVGDITTLAHVIGTCMSLVTLTGLPWLRKMLGELNKQVNVRYNQ